MQILLAQMDLVIKAVEQNPTETEKDCAIALLAMLVEKGKTLEKAA